MAARPGFRQIHTYTTAWDDLESWGLGSTDRDRMRPDHWARGQAPFVDLPVSWVGALLSWRWQTLPGHLRIFCLSHCRTPGWAGVQK